VPTNGKSGGLAQETTFAQEVRNLCRRMPMQRECVQAAKDQVIALARQIRRRERDRVVHDAAMTPQSRSAAGASRFT
jgi:hypothetical protein